MPALPLPFRHFHPVLCALPLLLHTVGHGVAAQPRHPGGDHTLTTFLRRCLGTRPESGVQDLYKTLYQEEFGVGHLIRSREAALSYLQRERAALDTSAADEALLEPCGPDSLQWRVNLRPYYRAGGSDSALVAAMLLSVEAVRGRRARFVKTWERVGSILRREGWPLPAAAYHTFTHDVRAADWPAVHHSDAYTRAYAPAYRVISRAMLRRLGVPLPGGVM